MQKLHRYSIDKGFKCVIDIKQYCIRFLYLFKNKEVWSIIISLKGNYEFSIRAENTVKYIDFIEKFPNILKEKISKGYGCNKKRGEKCQGGCRGIRVNLTDMESIGSEIISWIDLEYKART